MNSECLRVLEVVQSLEKGGRTVRFTNTVNGLRESGVFVLPLCFSKPESWVTIKDLEIITRTTGIQWSLVFQIYKLIKANNIHLIHAHCEFSQLYSSLAGRLAGISTVATFHRSDLMRYKASKSNQLIKLCCSKFVAVSRDRQQLLLENMNIDPADCFVVHGGTTINSKPSTQGIAAVKHKLGIEQDIIVLLSIGHLGSIKGHQDTLVAVDTLKQEHSSIHLYIAGDGSAEEKAALEGIVADRKLEKRVSFLGQIENSDEWMQASDIFVQPSIEEAFGLVFIEAGAKAKPVVATAVGGIKDIIVDGETGFLVDSNSPEQLAQRIAYLLSNSQLRTEMGDAGYERVSKSFSVSKMIHEYQQIFSTLI